MTIAYDTSSRSWAQGPAQGLSSLQEKFEVLKDIGDGSFGSVSLARVRGAGSHVARRGTLVAIKTMKKTFEAFGPCLELREIVFLRTLPHHPHLVPALDIFLDPLSKKLHIAMEYMDGNLYQLMKARDHKPFDGSSVKSILYQILSGLEHIHHNQFFHRDIKPENILVSVSAREEIGSAFKRYSQLVTPPSTPPSYTIKIADFGLARETHSKSPYTTYVSTRWYRAPEVLLRAGEYSAPVDIWAIGAMAVEIATLKPLFPGGNEVDQVWRICEIMGSPGNWVNKQGAKVGGGSWKDGVKLAQKLGFSFPKMAPHTMATILVQPQWSPALCHFVSWCLMWDPAQRPTSTQSLSHEYFTDATDPLRPKSSGTKLLSRKQSEHNGSAGNQSIDSTNSLSTKTSSWFRKSLVARESAPAVPQYHPSINVPISPRMSPVKPTHTEQNVESKARPAAMKRNTWANPTSSAAPMPILPSIRPISPLSNAVTAQAHAESGTELPKKIGRQLSMQSTGNHYADIHRHDAERALNGGNSEVISPQSAHKESFFSHLRKRARRLSGRHQTPVSAHEEYGWSSQNPMVVDSPTDTADPSTQPQFADLDRALQTVRYSLEASGHNNGNNLAMGNGSGHSTYQQLPVKPPQRVSSNPALKRQHSLPQNVDMPKSGRISPGLLGRTLSTSRTRRVAQKPTLPVDQYEVPDEQEELLDEAMASANAAATRLNKQQQAQQQYLEQQQVLQHQQNTYRFNNLYADQQQQQQHAGQQEYGRPPLRQAQSEVLLPAPYPTPSPSANRNSVVFGLGNGNASEVNVYSQSKPIDINHSKIKQQSGDGFAWPTPPYDENEWASAAAASIFAAGDHYR